MHISGQKSTEYGCIVTLREQTTRQMQCRHLPGAHKTSLADLGVELDASPEDWKVVCISTPRSVFRDLQGTRNRTQYERRDSQDAISWDPREHERNLLSKAGRVDLLEPLQHRNYAPRP